MILSKHKRGFVLLSFIFCSVFGYFSLDPKDIERRSRELDTNFRARILQYDQRPAEMDVKEYESKLLNNLFVKFLKLRYTRQTLELEIAETEDLDAQSISFRDLLTTLKNYGGHIDNDFNFLYKNDVADGELAYDMTDVEDLIYKARKDILRDFHFESGFIQEREVLDAFSLTSKYLSFKTLEEITESSEQEFYLPVAASNGNKYYAVSGERYMRVFLYRFFKEHYVPPHFASNNK